LLGAADHLVLPAAACELRCFLVHPLVVLAYLSHDRALVVKEDVSTEVEYKFTVQQVPEDEENADQQEIQKAAGGEHFEVSADKTTLTIWAKTGVGTGCPRRREGQIMGPADGHNSK